MRRVLIFIASVLILLLTNTSCKKYPEGPKYSLLPKKTRLCRTWELKETIPRALTPSGLVNTTLHIGKDETFWLRQEGVASTSGTWRFFDSKKYIYLYHENGGVSHYRILKLENKELWIELDIPNSRTQLFKYKSSD